MERLGAPRLALLVAPILVLAAPAAAHLDLTSPPPRLGGEAGGTQLKRGPCGQSTNARTSNVTVYEPGETITVSWNEYINHPSYFRVAFDVDGDDDFPIRRDMDSVVQAGDDPASVNPVGDVVLMYIHEPPDLSVHSVQVTLPNVECENCTLQVIQFMYDKLGDGRANEYYYQCADIALRSRSGGDGGTEPGLDGGPEADGGAGSSDAGTTGGAEDGGCGVAPGRPSGCAGAVGLSVLALCLWARRRDRHVHS